MTNRGIWFAGRGFQRLLTQETNISDLIQFCSERDGSPWEESIGFIPATVDREVRLSGPTAGAAGIADLVLRNGTSAAVIEIKLGHTMSAEQQTTYEMQPESTRLVLAALDADSRRITSDMNARWTFLGLTSLFSRWAACADPTVATVASEVHAVLRGWDQVVAGAFEPVASPTSVPLASIKHKSVARLITRRIRDELSSPERDRKRRAFAGVTSGGGLPLIQAWSPIGGDDSRRLQAEMRWWETKVGGELRFGVDFSLPESAASRREAFDLANSLDAAIDTQALRAALGETGGNLAQLIKRAGNGRPKAKGEWTQVVERGFKTPSNPDGVVGNRRSVKPSYHGDGTQRFQALADIDFTHATALDIVDLLDATLAYLEAALVRSLTG